ncbi:hypothetical protein FRC02_004963 [Tulasnella sp. 418]|nr:hypothetical protein FRC02_004963 [Tulasnella sp. 418]
MSLPSLDPDKSAAGITVDPKTLQRVIAPTKRADGSVRKEIKIRPGYTPQEDVSLFRGTKQLQAEARKQAKTNVPGWIPPSSSAKPGGSSGAAASGLSKSAKKNAKKREKKQAELEAKIKDSWEDDDEDEAPAPTDKKKDEEVEGLTNKLDEAKISDKET